MITFLSLLALGWSLRCAPDGDVPATGSSEMAPTDRLTQEVERGPIRAVLEFTPKSPRLSDEPTLRLTVIAESGVTVEMPDFGDSLGPFAIHSFAEPPPVTNGDRLHHEQTYRLEPLRVGEVTVVAFPITFIDNRAQGDGERHQLETEPLVVEVTSMFGDDAPSLADLRPSQPPLPLPATPKSWGREIAFGGGLLLLLLALLAWWRRRKSQPERQRQRTPRELAELELQALAAANPLGHGDIKTYYVEITAIVRRYVERTTGLRAPEQTTQEFLRSMKSYEGFEQEEKRSLAAFLEAADLVKFAAHQPQRQEIEQTEQRTREFVGLTSAPTAEQAA